MERVAGVRGVLAVVSLTASTLVVLARVVLGLSELGSGGSRAVAAARLAPNGGDGALTVLAGALVAACFVPPVGRRRRGLAIWGAVLAVVSVLATVAALALVDLGVAGWTVVWTVPELVVPVVVGVALVVLVREDVAPVAATDEPVAQLVAEPEPGPEPAPDPALQPAWPEDAASGAVWRTAGEAATGAPALGWGSTESAAWPLPALPPGTHASPDAADRA